MNKAFVALLLALLFSGTASADVLLASWNLKRFGHNPEKNLEVVADVLDDYEVIALQEVMRVERMASLEQALDARSTVDWSHLCSHAIGRNSYKEAYCFLWRTDRVTYETGALVYLDPGDVFAREPFSAIFRSDEGEAFLLATVHVVYGDSRVDRRHEARALRDYRDWLDEAFPDLPIVLAGDFNLEPDDEALRPLLAVARPVITKGATTLSSIDGRYANLYDHVWISGNVAASESGIRRFPAEFGLTHETARRFVSDHAPVWVRLQPERELGVQ